MNILPFTTHMQVLKTCGATSRSSPKSRDEGLGSRDLGILDLQGSILEEEVNDRRGPMTISQRTKAEERWRKMAKLLFCGHQGSI